MSRTAEETRSSALRGIDFTIIDSLRGLAALYVLLNHARGWLFMGGEAFARANPQSTWSIIDYVFVGVFALTRLGQEFVIFFFVISGFCISYSLERTDRLAGFFKRRAVRLYPPYVLGLAWAALVFVVTRSIAPELYGCTSETTVLESLCDSRDFLSAETIIGNLLYLPEGAFVFQYWSLTYEVIFYLLIPMFLMHKRSYLLASGVLFAVAWVLDGSAMDRHPLPINFMLDYNFYFAAGVALYIFWDRAKTAFLVSRRSLYVAVMAVFLLMILGNLGLGGTNRLTSALAAFLAVLLIVNFQGHKIKIPPLVWVGEFSYTLYLTHLATVILCLGLLVAVSPTVLPHVANRLYWLLAIPLSIGVAYALYLAAEKPSRRLLDRLRALSGRREERALRADLSSAP